MRARRDGDSALRWVDIFEILDRHDVQYIVIGSFAAILQDVDLDLTDIDIVPATESANLTHLVDALADLEAKPRRSMEYGAIRELVEDPSRITARTFWTFTTPYGEVDVVLRPKGFEDGYVALLDRAHLFTVTDHATANRSVDVVVADSADVYESKRLSARQKDITVLPKFVGIHPEDLRAVVREHYRADLERRGGPRGRTRGW